MKKSADMVRFRGKVSTIREASALVTEPGDAALVERGRPRLLLLNCPCGCGQRFPINLDPRSGPAWRLYGNRRHELSLYPSVWRESDCGSHYVIWNSRIFLFGRYEDDFESQPSDDENGDLRSLVLEALPRETLTPFWKVAEDIGAIPWDVLRVCRRLVKCAQAREGRGKQRGSFGRFRSKELL